jgi:hypothetical protein
MVSRRRRWQQAPNQPTPSGQITGYGAATPADPQFNSVLTNGMGWADVGEIDAGQRSQRHRRIAGARGRTAGQRGGLADGQHGCLRSAAVGLAQEADAVQPALRNAARACRPGPSAAAHAVDGLGRPAQPAGQHDGPLQCPRRQFRRRRQSRRLFEFFEVVGEMAQLTAGMRNNNPGEHQVSSGSPARTPSVNTDQGDPQAVYSNAPGWHECHVPAAQD